MSTNFDRLFKPESCSSRRAKRVDVVAGSEELSGIAECHVNVITSPSVA
jgi:hypothetical protein